METDTLPAVKITTVGGIVLGLRQQAFVLFRTNNYFFSIENPLYFFGNGSGGMTKQPG